MCSMDSMDNGLISEFLCKDGVQAKFSHFCPLVCFLGDQRRGRLLNFPIPVLLNEKKNWEHYTKALKNKSMD